MGAIDIVRNHARWGTGVVLDALMPPQCLSCRAPVDRQGSLCADCWRRVDYIDAPQCAICGFPFSFDVGADALCGACTRERPRYGRARAVMRYDDHSRRLVLAFKYGDRTEAVPRFATWMAHAGAALLDNADMLVPVPLHRLRLLARRFNQAALLAQGIARARAIEVVPDLLERVRRTPPQTGLSLAARARNVRGAFRVGRDRAARVRDRRVVLVDDVMTTGATADACVATLRRAGAANVDVLTLARVVRPRASAA